MTDQMTNQSPDGELIRSLWQEARELIKRLEGSTVQRLAIEAGEYKIEIERGAPTVTVAAAGPAPAAGAAAPGPAAVTEPAAEDNRFKVVSPLVGTFYRSGQPGSKPFVEEGDVVDAGAVIGIVEAMKIMNQIKTEKGGRIAEIAAKDGEWVEFQQVLVYVEPMG
jgi:acetyl-CoA carboxylase biotin carboxyl carrier protein